MGLAPPGPACGITCWHHFVFVLFFDKTASDKTIARNANPPRTIFKMISTLHQIPLTWTLRLLRVLFVVAFLVWWSNTRIILKRFTISLTRLMVRGDPWTMISSSTTTSFGLDLSRGTDKCFDNGASMRFICCVFNVVYRTTCVYQESMSVRLTCAPCFSSVVVT